MLYAWLKLIHILSSTLLLGGSLCLLCALVWAQRNDNLAERYPTLKLATVMALALITPTFIIQPVSGFALAYLVGYPMTSFWLAVSSVFYAFIGICWFPIVMLQLRMRQQLCDALSQQRPLDSSYQRSYRQWLWLMLTMIAMLIAVFYWMVFKTT